MQLKTLKDLFDHDPYGMILTNNKLIAEKELRQEAIKWAIYKSGSNLYEDKEVVKWIKVFFNITEEDLKND